MDSDPSSTGHAVEELARDGATMAEAASVAAAAFHDDPFFIFLSPNERLRRRGLVIYTRGLLGSLGDRGLVLGVRGAGGRILGVAAFVKPGSYPLPAGAQVRQAGAAFWALLPRPPALVSGSRYLLAIDRAHPHGELWYLALLVVDPAAQRSGVGGALQQHVYRDADAEQVPSYLETQKEANLAYYRRFGYELVQELRPVRRGPPLWTMRREPRPPAG
ncbi:MAG TPA: GNAT family N-acetyltransferase [Acidimicrobiia bacterium]|nr:GNAT family N-acetyltransferase [Acidimicrobiia bacterium]